MSDRMAVLNAGQVQQCDTPVNSYRKPASRFVAEFLGEANLVLAELVDMDNHFARVRLAADRPMFHVEHALRKPRPTWSSRAIDGSTSRPHSSTVGFGFQPG